MFYIVSRGSTATHWLSKSLSKHPDLVCFNSSRSFPPVEPGKGYPSNKKTWIKDNLEASRYLESLQLCERATHGSKIFGAIHGYHNIEMKELVEQMGGKFKYMVRHPLAQVHSLFIKNCYNQFKKINKVIENKDLDAYMLEKLKDYKAQKKHFRSQEYKPNILRKYISNENFLQLKKIKNLTIDKLNIFNKNNLDYKNADEMKLFTDIFSRTACSVLYAQYLYWQKWGVKEAIKMEDLIKNKDSLRNLILDISPGIKISEEYLQSIYSTVKEKVNTHRDKIIADDKIFDQFPDCLKEIFIFYYKQFKIKQYCDDFDYKITF